MNIGQFNNKGLLNSKTISEFFSLYLKCIKICQRAGGGGGDENFLKENIKKMSVH
jgi:hypothetical protein